MSFSRYKNEKSFEERKKESSILLSKYEGHIPVIVDKDPKCNLPDIEKQKFFVPSDLTFGHFLYVVRKRINVPATETIFIFVNRKLPHSNVSMGSLYCSNKDSDGFLYCIYCSDSAYG